MIKSIPVLAYEVDERDLIVYVNDEFIRIARQVGCPELADSSGLLGKRIWPFVRGRSVQAIYASIMTAVRLERRDFSFPFRCDTPYLKRELLMKVSLAANGNVRFETETVAETLRLRPVFLTFPNEESAPHDAAAMTTLCSKCEKVRPPGETAWVEVEDFIRQTGTFDGDKAETLAVTHGYCPSCTKEVLRLINEEND